MLPHGVVIRLAYFNINFIMKQSLHEPNFEILDTEQGIYLKRR